MLTREIFISKWMSAVNNNDPDTLAPFLADDFTWPIHINGLIDKAGLLELCAKTSMSDGSYLSTVCDSEDALVGYHVITVDGEPNEVMGAAKIRDGKAYEYHYLRTPRGE